MGCCAGKTAKDDESIVGLYTDKSGNAAYPENDYMGLFSSVRRQSANNELPLAGMKIVLGLYDYKSKEEGDVSFVRGDRMVVLTDTDEDWLTVRHLTTNQEGLIPSNFVAEDRSIESEDWFFGDISRSEAETLLLDSDTPQGCFLIRISQSNPNGFILSIKDHDSVKGKHVKHYKIKPQENGEGYFIAPNYPFPSLQALVYVYTRLALELCHALTVPCPRPRTVDPFS